jgi:hypothetical protein
VRSGDYAVNDLFAKVEVPVSETTLRSLFELDAANFVEGPLTRFDEFDGEFLARYRSLWEAAQRFARDRLMQRSSPGLMLSLRSDGPANPPRPEKSGAKVRFLVDPTIALSAGQFRSKDLSRMATTSLTI